MLRSMIARFRSSCRGCAFPILPGDCMVPGGKGKNYHLDCKDNPAVTTIYFPSSGTTIYRNAKGICEDAPCCGCCTF